MVNSLVNNLFWLAPQPVPFVFEGRASFICAFTADYKQSKYVVMMIANRNCARSQVFDVSEKEKHILKMVCDLNVHTYIINDFFE